MDTLKFVTVERDGKTFRLLHAVSRVQWLPDALAAIGAEEIKIAGLTAKQAEANAARLDKLADESGAFQRKTKARK